MMVSCSFSTPPKSLPRSRIPAIRPLLMTRILVMSNGRMAGILERGKDFGGVENEQETIMRLAAQYV